MTTSYSCVVAKSSSFDLARRGARLPQISPGEVRDGTRTFPSGCVDGDAPQRAVAVRHRADEERGLALPSTVGDRRVGPDHVAYVDHPDAIRAMRAVKEQRDSRR